MSSGGASAPHVSVPLSNIHNAHVVSLNFTPSTHLSLSDRVVGPLTLVSPTTSSTNMVVTGVPSMSFTSSPLFQFFQNIPSGSTPPIQGYPWYGGHIPPSMPYVGPTPTFVGVSARSPNPSSGFCFQTSS